jgi:hypothetical protein
MIAIMTGPVFGAGGQQKPEASKPQTPKGVVIRGCLNGEKLSRIDPQNVEPAVELKLPDVLRVTSIKVIQSQVKALNGHEVEVTGALQGIPGIETGLLAADSDKGKLYIGGNPDVTRKEPPTIHATLIKDMAPTCPAKSK